MLKRAALFLFCLTLSHAALAEVNLIVIGGELKRTPVAVVPFGWEGQAAEAPLDIAKVISADLYRSGRFAPQAERDMLQKPTTGAEIDFGDWTILGVEALVVGKVIQVDANVYKVQFRLFDPIGRNKFTATSLMRAAARCAALRTGRRTGFSKS